MADQRIRDLERRARSTRDPLDVELAAAARARTGPSVLEQARGALRDLVTIPPVWRPLRGLEDLTGKPHSWGGIRGSRASGGRSCRVGDVVWCAGARAPALVVYHLGPMPGKVDGRVRPQTARLCVTADEWTGIVNSYPRVAVKEGELVRLPVPEEWRELARTWRKEEWERRSEEAGIVEDEADPDPDPKRFMDAAEDESCGACYGTGADDGFGPEECDRCDGTGERH